MFNTVYLKYSYKNNSKIALNKTAVGFKFEWLKIDKTIFWKLIIVKRSNNKTTPNDHYCLQTEIVLIS